MAANEEDIFDTDYRPEILDKDSFEKLTVLPPNTSITNVKEYSFNNKIIKVLNDQYVSSYDKAKGDITLGKIDDKYQAPLLFPRGVLHLPNQYTVLKDIFMQMSSYQNYTTIYPFIHRQNLPALLSFFTIYPDFGPVYEEYLLDPDYGIELVDNVNIMGARIPVIFKRNDIKATVYLLLLSMIDSFDTAAKIKDDYILLYLDGSLRAMQYTLKDHDIKFLAILKNIHHMNIIWNSYPKLKKAVLYFAISMRSQSEEIRAATDLLENHSMQIIKCIIHFLTARPKTIAHTYPAILKDIVSFSKEKTKLLKELGPHWTYYKIIRPDDKTLSACNFPKLSKVAVIYVKHFFYADEIFSKVVEPDFRVEKELLDAAKIPLDSKYLKEESLQVYPIEIGLTAEMKKVAEDLGIDINKWENHCRMQKVPRIKDNSLSTYGMPKDIIIVGNFHNKYQAASKLDFKNFVVLLPNQYTILKELLIIGKDVKVDLYERTVNLAVLLSFFTIYSSFETAYQQYILNPDSGIQFIDFPQVLDETMPRVLKMNNVRATVHLLLLLMVKKFDGTNKDDQIKKYFENRLKALQLNFRDDTVKFLLTMENLDKMFYIWNHYPKLKFKIFYLAISLMNDVIEINEAIKLIAEYSFGFIPCIFKFINSEPTTLAHTYSAVYKEVSFYLKECIKLKEQFCHLWPFIKVIRPDDTTLWALKFPNLSKAAVVYVKKFFKTNADQFFQNLVEPNYPVCRGLVKAAKITCDPEYLKLMEPQASTVWLTPEETKVAIALAKDINRYIRF